MRNDRKEGNYSPHQSKKVFPKKYLFSSQNNGLFYQEQRLVLPKTTARFAKNNGSFYQKQRLVLLRRKTSAEAFAVISSRAHHPIWLFHKPSQGENCANTTNLRRNKSHNTK